MMTELKSLSDNLSSRYDVFIASASYEKRCLSIISNLQDKTFFKYKLVSLSRPHKHLMEENLSVFLKLGFKPVEIDNCDQLFTVDNWLLSIFDILQAEAKASFLIDITTFTRQTLLILIRLLRNLLTEDNRVDFLYTCAKEYAVGLTESEKWLTKGIIEVNSVFGYLGIIRPSRPYHLIILMGYEVERASSLIYEYEPSKISIGFGNKDSSINPEHYELNLKRYLELKSEFPLADHFEFSCIDVQQCKIDVLKEAKKYRNYNVIISSMNNKISTVATALAAIENEEIQLALAIPAVYNTENYSIPGDNCYLFSMDEIIKRKV